MCKTRRACGDCRSRPEWRKAMGAPEACPFLGQIPADITKKTAIPGQLATRRAICAACPHYQLPTCCNCSTSRQDPARELLACRFGFWPKDPPDPTDPTD